MDTRTELGGHLSGITYGRQLRPIFCVIYGPDGVGKTTWASKAPEVVFIGLESTATHDVSRLPKPETIAEFRQQIMALRNSDHPFRSLAIDSLSGLEPVIWKQVCAEGQVKTIEDYAGGFGKGYVRAADIWRGVLAELAELALKMHVILIAHSKIKRFEDPGLPSGYDRYQISVNDQAGAVIRQAVDAVLFANFKARVKEVSKIVGKGIGEDERALFTVHRPAFDAKNRFNLPFELPLEWVEFARRVKEFYGAPAQPLTAPPALVPATGDNGEIPRTEPVPETAAA
jgi:hypothetical protein